MDWWKLPGPQSFVYSIVQDLRDGKNVVVLLPEHSPDKLQTAVRETIDEEGRWERIDYQNSSESSPADFLYHHYVNEAVEIQTISNLFRHDEIKGKIIWLDGISLTSWTSWREFLIRYESVCRSMGILERTVFCIFLNGISPTLAPCEEVCLSVRKYSGVANSLDMLIYASFLKQNLWSKKIKSNLITMLISKIALWDAKLADSLSRQSFETLLSPSKFLREIAIARGWLSDENIIQNPLWEIGMKDNFDGEECCHSCFLINETELQHRLWCAEVSVLYPFIEEQRQIILNCVKKFLSVPFTTRFGEVINNIKELEIGHIEAILSNNSSFRDQRMLNRISDLRRMRNDLAHLIPITDIQLLSEAVQNPLKSSKRFESNFL